MEESLARRHIGNDEKLQMSLCEVNTDVSYMCEKGNGMEIYFKSY